MVSVHEVIDRAAPASSKAFLTRQRDAVVTRHGEPASANCRKISCWQVFHPIATKLASVLNRSPASVMFFDGFFPEKVNTKMPKLALLGGNSDSKKADTMMPSDSSTCFRMGGVLRIAPLTVRWIAQGVH